MSTDDGVSENRKSPLTESFDRIFNELTGGYKHEQGKTQVQNQIPSATLEVEQADGTKRVYHGSMTIEMPAHETAKLLAAKRDMSIFNTPDLDEDFEALRDVLARAYEQAAVGKGQERHGNGLPFEDQPMQTISNLLDSPDGMAFQAMKKIAETKNLPDTKAKVRELLGAIVYIAGMVLWLEDNEELSGD